MRAAFLAYESCAIWQVTLLQKILKDMGWNMDTLTLGGRDVVSDGGLLMCANHAIEHANPQDYQLVFMAGGDLTPELVDDKRMAHFLRSTPGIIGASCASSVLVAKAGQLKSRFTAMPMTVDQFSDAFGSAVYEGSDVCVDGNVITSKGSAHLEFTMAVLDKLGAFERYPRLRRLVLHLGRNQLTD